MSIEITESEYRAEIESICESIITDYPEGADYNDTIHEIVDGHTWIVWTAYHLAIYAVSESRDAWKDIYSDLSAFDSLEDIHQAVAYFALCADVHDAFQGCYEEMADRVFCEDNKVLDENAEADDLTVEDEYGDLYRFESVASADVARRLVFLSVR